MARFRQRDQQHCIDPNRWCPLTNAKSAYGRRQGLVRGPLPAKVPYWRWRTLTFIAGRRWGEMVAPCVPDGPIELI